MKVWDFLKNNRNGIDAFTLKMIAAITMLIDHTGAIFFPQYLLLRCVGRISFPIFAFLIVEGFLYTKNLKKYARRLFVFALISEFPFDFAFFNGVYIGHQNVIFTFTIAILIMYIDKKYGRKAGAIATVALGLTAEFLRFDYGMFGVLLVMIFYWTYDKFYNRLIISSGVLGLLVESYQRFDLLAIIPIALYNGKKGINAKYFFYVFYPGHLVILYIIHMLIGAGA